MPPHAPSAAAGPLASAYPPVPTGTLRSHRPSPPEHGAPLPGRPGGRCHPPHPGGKTAQEVCCQRLFPPEVRVERALGPPHALRDAAPRGTTVTVPDAISGRGLQRRGPGAAAPFPHAGLCSCRTIGARNYIPSSGNVMAAAQPPRPPGRLGRPGRRASGGTVRYDTFRIRRCTKYSHRAHRGRRIELSTTAECPSLPPCRSPPVRSTRIPVGRSALP